MASPEFAMELVAEELAEIANTQQEKVEIPTFLCKQASEMLWGLLKENERLGNKPRPRPEHVVLRKAAEKILMRQPTRPIDSSPVWDSGYAEALAHLDRLAAEAEKGGA